MITDVIVLASVAFAVGFAAAWLVSPALRAWIEQPKHRFQEAAGEYDREQREPHDGQEHSSS